MRYILFGLFFVSGASALIFETLWQRMMMLALGASAPATSAILMAFFLGLALGGYWGSRLLKRFGSALTFYALVEGWICLWALSVPTLLKLISQFQSLFAQYLNPTLFNDGSTLGLCIRLGLAILVVLPATMGMGATIPVMSRLIHEGGYQGMGQSVGLAYGFNTLGAVLGCLLTGFYFLPHWGVTNALYAAAGLNAIVFIVASALAVLKKVENPDATCEKVEIKNGALLSLYFAAAFLALGYEVVWMRLLNILGAGGLVTFTLSLSTYLLGFSLGALILYPVLQRKYSGKAPGQRPGQQIGLRIFSQANWATGLSVFLLLPVLYFLPSFFWGFLRQLNLPATIGSHPAWVFSLEAVYCLGLLLLPCVFLGLNFPAVCEHLIKDRKHLGDLSGKIYFYGNLAGVLGVALTSLFLIPHLGLVQTLAFFMAMSFLVGLISRFIDRTRPRPGYASLAATFILIGLSSYLGWRAPPVLREGRLFGLNNTWHQEFARAPGIPRGYWKIDSYRAGASGTVMVKSLPEDANPIPQRQIFIDDQAVASTQLDARIDAKMLAHLPLFLHEKPQRALTVGFGSGATSWSMTRHGIETEAVEIEPKVLEVAPLFAQQNQNVWQEKNYRLYLNDARHFLLTTDRFYDVISTDVTNLQYKQNASLYSLEYFQLMQDKLNPNGIACAWIPLSGLTETDLKILMKTFQTAFPHASLWYLDYSKTTFALLMGTPERLQFSLDRFRKAFDNQAVRQDLLEIGIEHPFQLAQFLYLDERGFEAFTQGTEHLHTDNRPLLEYSSPFSYYSRGIDMLTLLNVFDSLRPHSLESYIDSDDDQDRNTFNRVERFARAWGQANRHYAFDRKKYRFKYRYLRASLNRFEEALHYFPDYRWGQEKRRSLRKEVALRR